MAPTLHARDYIDRLAARGRHDFSSREAQEALGVTPAAAKLALNRLAKRGLIASPARGFYVIVPPEYRSLGSLPAEQFISALMQRRGLPITSGSCRRPSFTGLPIQRPQEFQVMVAQARRPIIIGAVRVAFMVRSNIAAVPVQSFNTPRGTARVSTPEATAVDLIGYPDRIGGLDQAITVLSELAERLDPEKLVTVAQTAPVAWAQRLGYLLVKAGAEELAGPLKAYVQQCVRQTAVLIPKGPRKNAARDQDWKLIINAEVEAEP